MATTSGGMITVCTYVCSDYDDNTNINMTITKIKTITTASLTAIITTEHQC
jgi:hypothetical protein